MHRIDLSPRDGGERTVPVRTGFLLVQSALQVLGEKDSGSLQDGQGEDGGVAHTLGVGGEVGARGCFRKGTGYSESDPWCDEASVLF